jgi:esterase/lipase
MLFLKKCWDWCVEHWKLLLVSIGGLIAFFIGYQRASRNTQRVKLELDLANKDKDLIEENNTKFHDAVVESVLDYEEKKVELLEKKNDALEKANKQVNKTKKNILNSEDELNKILKDKWGLKNDSK